MIDLPDRLSTSFDPYNMGFHRNKNYSLIYILIAKNGKASYQISNLFNQIIMILYHEVKFEEDFF